MCPPVSKFSYFILWLHNMRAVQSYCTFQSNEFWAIEVYHSQQSRAVTHVLQQVVQQREVLKCPTGQVISAVTYLRRGEGATLNTANQRLYSQTVTCSHTHTHNISHFVYFSPTVFSTSSCLMTFYQMSRAFREPCAPCGTIKGAFAHEDLRGC